MRSAIYWKGFIMVDNYDDKRQARDAAFAERVAAPLRAAEHAHPSFERRLMEKVRAEGPALYPVRTSSNASWWRTQRVFRLSPLAGLAMAAGLSAIVAVSAIAVGSRIAARSGTTTRSAQSNLPADTIQLVRFVFVDSGAARVELVGDFNEWTKGVTQLKRSGAPGVWAVSVPLAPGRHEYAFIINGSRWVADPLAIKSSDDFGTESSVIRVGAQAHGAT
jgi:hypothetical protein